MKTLSTANTPATIALAASGFATSIERTEGNNGANARIIETQSVLDFNAVLSIEFSYVDIMDS